MRYTEDTGTYISHVLLRVEKESLTTLVLSGLLTVEADVRACRTVRAAERCLKVSVSVPPPAVVNS